MAGESRPRVAHHCDSPLAPIDRAEDDQPKYRRLGGVVNGAHRNSEENVFHSCDTEPQPRNRAPRPKPCGGDARTRRDGPDWWVPPWAQIAKGDALDRRAGGSPRGGIVEIVARIVAVGAGWRAGRTGPGSGGFGPSVSL
jgi:hypothetical protein